MIASLHALPDHQRRLLGTWLPGATVVEDHSWGLVERHVLSVEHDGQRYVVKAGGRDDHHMDREIEAHRRWLEPWTSILRAPQLVHADAAARLLVTTYLPGELVLDTPAVRDPAAYRQAGELLALLHDQTSVEDRGHVADLRRGALAWLDRPHRIDAAVERRLRAEVDAWDGSVISVLVPTHGDWQPRNWIVHRGVVSVIDFGRAAMRTRASDLTRLDAQQFRDDPTLERAFLEGYGSDPRNAEEWRRQRLGEAIGTAVWAHEVGDEAFEAQGHRMIADVLDHDV